MPKSSTRSAGGFQVSSATCPWKTPHWLWHYDNATPRLVSYGILDVFLFLRRRLFEISVWRSITTAQVVATGVGIRRSNGFNADLCGMELRTTYMLMSPFTPSVRVNRFIVTSHMTSYSRSLLQLTHGID